MGQQFCVSFPESAAKGSSSKSCSLARTEALTPLTYTTLQSTQHFHRSHTPRHSTYIARLARTAHHSTSPCTHHRTYTAYIHHATALTSLALHTPQHTTPLLPLFSLVSKRVGLANIVGAHPLRVSCVSHRSRCGAVRIFNVVCQPSPGTVRVESLSLWRRANSKARLPTLCGDRVCRIALVVAPCEFSTSFANPRRGSCLSNRSRCGAARILKLVSQPSAGIVRVESLSMWRRANLKALRRTSRCFR